MRLRQSTKKSLVGAKIIDYMLSQIDDNLSDENKSIKRTLRYLMKQEPITFKCTINKEINRFDHEFRSKKGLQLVPRKCFKQQSNIVPPRK